jgi:hypothetical protein
MRGYFGLGQLSATEKQDILDQHKSLYNGYQTMQPQVSNTQPLYTYDFAGDKDGMVVNNKGEVKKYTNMGINEQVEEKQMCEQCGGTMREDVCEQCGSKMEGEVEEGVGKLDDIYDEEDLNPSAGFDYIEGPSNSLDTFEKMHKNLYKEEEYEDPDNEDDGFEDLEVGDQLDEDITDEMPYEKGSRGMKASRARASFIPTPQENEILSNLFGQYGEDIPPIVIRYLRKLPRKTLLNRLIRVGLIDKDLLKGSETIEEQGFTGGGNAPDMDISNIEPAYDFISNGPDEVYPTEGEMEEQNSPEEMLKYKRRGITYSNVLSFIEAAQEEFDMCQDFGDEFEYADNVITSALSSLFVQTGQDLDSDFYYEVHDLCKDWFGDDLITAFVEECGGFEEEEEEEFMFMESAFTDEEIDEANDVSGSQGIYGDMDPPYDFDSNGPGGAGPYQRSSYYEGEMEEEEVEDDEELEIDEDLQESFHNQKNKIVEMMSRMKVIK